MHEDTTIFANNGNVLRNFKKIKELTPISHSKIIFIIIFVRRLEQ